MDFSVAVTVETEGPVIGVEHIAFVDDGVVGNVG